MTTTATLRAFIAIDLAPDVRRALRQTRNELGQRLGMDAVRWVRPENIHLTLRFLGEAPTSTVSHIAETMDRVGSKFRPIELMLDELGCFPNPKKPRVIWIGVKGERHVLLELQQELSEELVPLGWHPEKRPYHPHLTLGRVKHSHTRIGLQLPWGKPVKPAGLNVDAFCLFESKLNPTGAVYTIQHTTYL